MKIEMRNEKVASEVIVLPRLYTATVFSDRKSKGKKKSTLCIVLMRGKLKTNKKSEN